MAEYPASFADFPESIGERRAEQAEGNGAKWTPREALIATLRRMDSEENDFDALIVCYRTKDSDGGTVTFFSNASPDVHTALGLLAHIQFRLLMDG